MAEDILLPLPAATVEYVGELAGPSDRGGGRDGEHVFTFHRTFLVKTVDHLDAAFVAMSAANLPDIYAAYSGPGANEAYAGAILVDAQATVHDDHRNLWAVRCEYTTRPSFHPDYQAADPLQRRAVRRVRFERERVAMERDQNGLAFLNAAEDPFAPVEIDRLYAVIELKKNIALFSLETMIGYVNRVNTTAAFGMPAHSLKVHDVYAEEEKQEGTSTGLVNFHPATLVLHYRPAVPATINTTAGFVDFRPWRHYPLNAGFRELVGGVRRTIFSPGTATPVTREALLDAAGAQLAVDGTPVYLEFVLYPEATYAPLVALFGN